MQSIRTVTLALIALAALRHSGAFAMPQDSATALMTGRAVSCQEGKIATFECHNVEVLSFLPKHLIGESSGADLWGWHDSTTGREFLVIGGASTAFVDVTDPVNPKYLGVLPPHEGVTRHSAQSVKVYRNHAFIGYEGAKHGIQVFDLTQLRDVKNPPVEFQETAHYDSVANTHTITMNAEAGFATINGSNTCGGGLHMIDVRTPTTPVFLGCYTEVQASGLNGAAYVHDAQCVVYRGPDQQYQGRQICLSAHGGVVSIADVTDKQNPKTITIATYPNVGYAHQGWLTEDQRHFFLDDELDENPAMLAMLKGIRKSDTAAVPPSRRQTRTIVFDLNDLDDPVVLTEYFATTTSTDHNLYIRGRYMYQGNYGAGLRIVDIADPRTPKEVGYLTNIGSAWGTYPFLKNDVVAVSTSKGLMLARLLTREEP